MGEEPGIHNAALVAEESPKASLQLLWGPFRPRERAFSPHLGAGVSGIDCVSTEPGLSGSWGVATCIASSGHNQRT